MEIFFLTGSKAGKTILVEFIRLDNHTGAMEVEYKGGRHYLNWDDYNSYYSGSVDNMEGHVL
jgi:hypothetical protein